MISWVLAVYAGLVTFMMQTEAAQGRLLFPAILPIALGLSWGLVGSSALRGVQEHRAAHLGLSPCCSRWSPRCTVFSSSFARPTPLPAPSSKYRTRPRLSCRNCATVGRG
ncbi:MAG: hypothetical protein R3C44_11460 [Chloroflexota bacterium]